MDIQGLKDKILQLAIQGKLVEQDKNDEPASELLKRIKEERDKLVKEKKIRKPKKLAPIEDDEKPFDIPDTWEWVRLGEVSSQISSKKHQIKQSEIINEGLYPVVSQSMNLIEGYSNKCDKLFEVNNPIIIFGDHTRHVKYVDFNFIVGADGVKIINPIVICDKYLYLSILYNSLNIEDRGYSRHFKFLDKKLISMPPLAEQKRIVEKIDQLFALIDELDSNKEELLEVINLTRNQVLQKAMQGKLVKQNPEDEPASILLEKIKEERDRLVKEKKIRKPKKLEPIEDDEKPFDIPDSWEWVRINDICDVKGGKRIPKGYKFSDEKTENIYLRVTDMKSRTILEDDIRYISEEVYNMIKNYTISSDDLYVTIAGTIGAVGKIPLRYNNMNLTENASKLSFYKNSECSLDYTMYSIESNLVQSQFNNKVNKMAQPKLSLTEIKSTVFPLPPLAEQKRIVKKVDVLMDMLNELENQLNNTYQ